MKKVEAEWDLKTLTARLVEKFQSKTKVQSLKSVGRDGEEPSLAISHERLGIYLLR